jgi:hypothetical protein
VYQESHMLALELLIRCNVLSKKGGWNLQRESQETVFAGPTSIVRVGNNHIPHISPNLLNRKHCRCTSHGDDV